jgi:hypothetical protein
MDVTGLEFNSYAEELFPPTESWEITAQFKGVTVQQLLYEAMFRPTQLKIIDVPGKGVKPDIRTDVTVIPGHEWMGNYGPSDPHRHRLQ